MESALDEIGWISETIVNVVTGHMIDGHMRATIAIGKDAPVPCTEVELTLEEEQIALATFDPIGSMAGIDKAQYGQLVALVQSDNDSIASLLEGLREHFQVPIYEMPEQATQAYQQVNPFAARVQQEIEEQQASNGTQLDVDGATTDASGPEGTRPVTGTSAGQMAEAQVKIIQVYLQPAQFDTFMVDIRLLAERYATANVTDTIREAVRYAAQGVRNGQ